MGSAWLIKNEQVVYGLKPVKSKSLVLTLILSALISGLGEIYLGLIQRGVIILVIGIAITVALNLLLPSYIAIPAGFVYWGWQLYDAYRQFKKGTY